MKVILQIGNDKHRLVEDTKYNGGGKHRCICPECSLYSTHFEQCWETVFGVCNPLCSSLAKAGGLEDDFAVRFEKTK